MEKAPWEENLCSQIAQAGALPINIKISPPSSNPQGARPVNLTISNTVDAEIVLHTENSIYTTQPKNGSAQKEPGQTFESGAGRHRLLVSHFAVVVFV